ncbi:MAG TPA: hypothetical protein VFP72_09010 [Kineosporiaceae bacterium]|nr:hypothetical protein [Kineosporiaceae bacterium]
MRAFLRVRGSVVIHPQHHEDHRQGTGKGKGKGGRRAEGHTGKDENGEDRRTTEDHVLDVIAVHEFSSARWGSGVLPTTAGSVGNMEFWVRES